MPSKLTLRPRALRSRATAAVAAAVLLALAIAALAPGRVVAAAPPAKVPPVAPVTSPARHVEFENAGRPAREKELLAHYAEQVARWAMIQRIVDAVAAQNAKPLTMDHIHQIDDAWTKGANPEGLATALMQNDCARALQALLAANPGWGEAFVTDSRGANVCMAARTSDYWQGDEPKFIRAWADGKGAIFVGDSSHDESTGLELVHISAPVLVGGKVAGVLILGHVVGGG